MINQRKLLNGKKNKTKMNSTKTKLSFIEGCFDVLSFGLENNNFKCY